MIFFLSAVSAATLAFLYFLFDQTKEKLKDSFFQTDQKISRLDEKLRTLTLELKSLKQKTETLQNQTNDLFLSKTRKKKV